MKKRSISINPQRTGLASACEAMVVECEKVRNESNLPLRSRLSGGMHFRSAD